MRTPSLDLEALAVTRPARRVAGPSRHPAFASPHAGEPMMKKLALNVDALAVESFTAGGGPSARGAGGADALLAPTGPRCPSHHQSECCATDFLGTACC